MRERGPLAYRAIAAVGRPLLSALTRRDWDDPAKLPSGGVIVVPNHLSNADPPLVAHFIIAAGRWPRFLAKAGLFDLPGIGPLVRATGQVPVHRRTPTASDSLAAARTALAQGQCLVLYPEGTITHDPDLWPMTGHPGAARLALETGAPVVPLGQWGAHLIFDRWYVTWPRLWPRPTITMRLGAPVDLDDLRPAPGEPVRPAAVREASERIMAAITAVVAEIRGLTPPERRYDLRRDWPWGIRPDGRPGEPPLPGRPTHRGPVTNR